MTDQVGVADYDQHHAQAIDYLRQAQTFLLAVPRPPDDDSDEWRIVVTGGGVGYDSFHQAVASTLAASEWGRLSAGWGNLERAWRRRRQILTLMVTATVLNLIALAVSLARG
jgi:hypothetical protein